jgi:Cytochrome oxidase c subunit VIb
MLLCRQTLESRNVALPALILILTIIGRLIENDMQEGIPLRETRKVCYMARDTFFTCCDRNSIENPLRDVENVQRFCKAEKAKFDKDCISSWVYRQALLLFDKGGLLSAETIDR